MSRLMFRLTAASALAVMALSMPLASYLHVGVPAMAKDNGGGHGGGNGGGNGGNHGGNGGGNSGHDAGHSGQGSKGKSDAAKSRGTESDDDADDAGSSGKSGKSGNALGALNAAHASPTARAHAAPNSAVGRIASYERERDEALAMEDPAERDAALDDAVAELEDAFGRKLSETQIAEINALLDRD